jgi:hypothetical protein
MRTEIIEILGTPKGKKDIERLAEVWSEGEFTSLLLDLSFHKNEQIGFRAAWVLENVFRFYPQHFAELLPKFLERYSEQRTLSAMRHFAKILAFATDKKAQKDIKNFFENYDTAKIVETNFAWLIDEKVPVAVKSHCLNILANLVPKHDWVKAELIETMEHLVDLESIAFFAKVKQVRKQLKV